MRVAIHQPNFMPWLGLFHRISMVDCFVLFDHVQAVRGKSWFSRNRILLDGEPRWLTLPTIKAGQGFQSIDEVLVNYDSPFERKHLGTLRQAYGKCQHFKAVMPWIESLYSAGRTRLAEWNSAFIVGLTHQLGYSTRFVSSRSLLTSAPALDELKGNDLVLNICQTLGCATYISGTGCLDFIAPPTFAPQGIDFRFQRFDHPTYPQCGGRVFVSHLSAVDALYNLGFEGVRTLLDAVGPTTDDPVEILARHDASVEAAEDAP